MVKDCRDFLRTGLLWNGSEIVTHSKGSETKRAAKKCAGEAQKGPEYRNSFGIERSGIDLPGYFGNGTGSLGVDWNRTTRCWR